MGVEAELRIRLVDGLKFQAKARKVRREENTAKAGERMTHAIIPDLCDDGRP